MTELIGVAEHYAQFVKLCRLRMEQLGVTMDTLDAIAGFSPRYTAKLFCGDKSVSILSFFDLIDTLGLRLEFHHDETKLAKLRSREDWIKLRRPGRRFRKRGGAVRLVFRRDFYRQIGRKGAFKRSMLRKKRMAQTEKARAARWGGK